jgi:GNAT superfamily N-acetyltransferase
MSPVLRFSRPDDIPTLVRLINAAFVAESPYIEGERVNADTLHEILDRGKFLLFEENGEPIACAFIEPRGERAHLGLVSVDPARQQTGLGTKLMAAVEDHCRTAGFHEMELRFINHRTELQHFYARAGFHSTGVEEVPTTHRTKVPFHFVQMTKPLL